MSSSKARSLPQLNAGEVTLLDLAADDPRDTVSLSDKEASIVQLHHQSEEQELEKALLQQGSFICIILSISLTVPEPEPSSTSNAEELATAERELLEARATYTVRKKAASSVLMTDPILKSVHSKGQTPIERYGQPAPGLHEPLDSATGVLFYTN